MSLANSKWVSIGLGMLRSHAMNSNVMNEELLKKLVGHVERTGQYPPLIVRLLKDKTGEKTYEVLDGHHRWAALKRLGHEAAQCVVWQVDDTGALELLATLNRLRGRDEPRKRGALIEALAAQTGQAVNKLASRLPETGRALEKLAALSRPAPAPRIARRLDELPVSTHFFLSGAQSRRLEAVLKEIGLGREAGLMKLVEQSESQQ